MSSQGNEPDKGIRIQDYAARIAEAAQLAEKVEKATDFVVANPPWMRVNEVEGPPPLAKRLLFDQAYRLTTMPRGRFEEYTAAAFWSTVATVTGAIGGLIDLLADKPAQSKLFDVAEVLIFGICAAITMLGVVKGRNEQIADEYLRELYGMPPKPKPAWWEIGKP